MKEILDFLRDLDNNNHREWFNANKGRYQEVLKKWYAFCESLITEIGRFDKDIPLLRTHISPVLTDGVRNSGNVHMHRKQNVPVLLR